MRATFPNYIQYRSAKTDSINIICAINMQNRRRIEGSESVTFEKKKETKDKRKRNKKEKANGTTRTFRNFGNKTNRRKKKKIRSKVIMGITRGRDKMRARELSLSRVHASVERASTRRKYVVRVSDRSGDQIETRVRALVLPMC